MATYSSILTWTPHGQSTGSQRVEHNWDTSTFTFPGLADTASPQPPSCTTMVSPHKFFGYCHWQLGPSAASLSKLSKTAENLHILSTGVRGFNYKRSCLHRIIFIIICRSYEPLHAIMALVVSSSMGRKLMKIHPVTYGSEYLVHGKHWPLDKQFPVLCALSRLTGWMASL